MLKVSIIIINYNSEDHTLDCLNSLKNISINNFEHQVLVVDNNSEIPFKLVDKPDNVTIIRTDKNLGFTGGNNFGIKYCFKNFNPDYILLLNNDTLVSSNFLKNLLIFAQNHSDLGAVSPKIYFENGSEYHQRSYNELQKGKVIWFAGGSIDWKNMYGFHRGVDEVDYGQFELTEIIRPISQIPYYGYSTMNFATGCCVLLPSNVLKKVGFFDNSYFLYWEDVDLSQRILQKGYKLYFCSDAIIWHKNAGSSGGSGSSTHSYYQFRNRLRFALKFASIKTKLLVLLEYIKNQYYLFQK